MADGTDSGWRVRKLATHGIEIHAVVGATVGGRPVVVTAGDDGAIRTWDLESGEPGDELRVDQPPEAVPVTRVKAVQTDQVIGPEDPVPTALAVVPGIVTSLVHSGWSDGTVRSVDLAAPAWMSSTLRPDAVPVAALAGYLDDELRQCVVAGISEIIGIVVTGSSDAETAIHTGYAESLLLRSLAVAQGGDDPQIYAGTDDGVARWRIVSGPDGEWLAEETPPLRIGSPKRSRLLVSIVASRGHDALVATDFNLLDVLVDPALSRPELSRSREEPRHRPFDPGVGEITALSPTAAGSTSALAVGGASGQVVVVDPWNGQQLSEPVDVGEPVAGLGTARFEGREVLLVGGRDGGVFVVEAGGGVRMTDQVELQDDLPAVTRSDDRLRRSPLAEALAVRLQRRHEDGKEASFLVHLDGRWGSGKTTVLNFVADELGDGWTIVRYNAWRQARIGPPWWTLLTALRIQMLRRRSLRQRAWLWARELFDQRIWRTSGLPATALLLLVAAGVFMLVRPEGTDVGDALTTVQGVAATLTALATLFAGTQFVARFFSWHSPRGAKAFEDLDANPMDRVASHFSWLVREERRPIAFFVDDIDRCSCDQVVDLLEAVQTLVRDAGEREEAVLSPCFVVAGDGAWIRNAFEERYSDFSEEIGEPGRPLGYLFLAKIFQLTMPVPRIGPVRQSQFFRELLGLRGNDIAGETVSAARVQVEAAPDDDAQQQVLAGLPQAVREVVAPVAVRRQTERAFTEATEHRLTGFAPFLPDNPRAVKRFLNAFALTRSVRTVEGQAIPTATLALWTILEIRWPELADCLSDHPSWIERPDDPPPEVPDTIRRLLTDPAVQALLGHEDGGPLTAADVVSCRGG